MQERAKEEGHEPLIPQKENGSLGYFLLSKLGGMLCFYCLHVFLCHFSTVMVIKI